MKHYTTDPGAQGKFIRSLRELADHLDRHPSIPVPKFGATIQLHASSADYGGRAQVFRAVLSEHLEEGWRRPA